ncbi:MAG: hypothetical protein ACK44A_13795, partial [Roseateles sp.]
ELLGQQLRQLLGAEHAVAHQPFAEACLALGRGGRELRRAGDLVPALCLTARDRVAERVEARAGPAAVLAAGVSNRASLA